MVATDTPTRTEVLFWVMWPATGMLVAGGLTALALRWRLLVDRHRHGILIPFNAVAGMFLGGLTGLLWERRSKASADIYLLPLASGLIAGEALVAVFAAILPVPDRWVAPGCAEIAYVHGMHRLVFAAVLTAAAVAQAQPSPPAGKPGKPAPPPPARLPAIGDALGLDGVPGTPRLDWLYDVPSPGDAAGKVVIHWFCAPRIAACTDDLARLVTLRDAGRVYIVAYINGSKAEARKLDPIRESEGVGRGTVAFGRGASKLMKDLGVTGPASIVVGADGKVLRVVASGAPGDLDARDAEVKDATGSIKAYLTVTDGPAAVQVGEKFQLSITIKLATWLKYSTRTPMEYDITAPSDLKCDALKLRGDQIKIDGRLLTATVTCSGPRGSYGVRGELRFGYDAPGGAIGLEAQSMDWKFEIKP